MYEQFIAELEKIQEIVKKLKTPHIRGYDANLDFNDYANSATQALWNISYSLKIIAENNGNSLPSGLQLPSLLQNLNFLEENIWTVQIKDKKTFKLANIYANFLIACSNDSGAKTLLSKLSPEICDWFLINVPTILNERLLTYYVFHPDEQAELFDFFPETLRQELSAFVEEQLSYFSPEPDLPQLLDLEQDFLTFIEPDSHLDSQAKITHYEQILAALHQYQSSLEIYEQQVINVNLPPIAQETHQDSYEHEQCRIKNDILKCVTSRRLMIVEVSERAQQMIDNINPDSWVNRLETAKTAITVTENALQEPAPSFSPRPVNQTLLDAVQARVSKRRKFIDESLTVLEYFLGVLTDDPLSDDSEIPSNHSIFEYIHTDEANEESDLILAYSIYQNTKPVFSLLSTPKWKIAPSDYDSSIKSIHKSSERETLQTAVIEKINLYKHEKSSASDLSSAPPTTLRTGLYDFHRQYYQESQRRQRENQALQHLAFYRTNVLALAVHLAKLNNLIVQRDYKLYQLNQEIYALRQVLINVENLSPSSAYENLSQETHSIRIRELHRKALELNDAFLAQPPQIDIPHVFDVDLPNCANEFYNSLVTQHNELSRHYTTMTTAATMTTTAEELQQIEQELRGSKLKSLHRGYQKILQDFEHDERNDALERYQQELRKLPFNLLHHTSEAAHQTLCNEIRQQQSQLFELSLKLQRNFERIAQEKTAQAQQRQELHQRFFKGKLPGIYFSDNQRYVGDGHFTRYLKQRNQDYMITDIFTTMWSFIVWIVTGTFVNAKSDHMLRTEYLHKLNNATNAYAHANTEDIHARKTELDALVTEGLSKPDQNTSLFSHSHFFTPRKYSPLAYSSNNTLRSNLQKFQREVDSTYHQIIDTDNGIREYAVFSASIN